MKSKSFVLFALMLLAVSVVTACAPVAHAFVRLNPDLANWIVYGVTLLFGFLLMKLATLPQLSWLVDYLGRNQAIIIAWFSGIVIQFLQAGILDKIPQMWDNVVTIVMQLIVAVIVTLYGFHLLGKRGVRGFRA